MENFKGTKGPWIVFDTYEEDRTLKVWDFDEQAHGAIVRTDEAIVRTDELGDINYFEAKANALLISKAPEMLDMLEDILNVVDWSTEHWQGNGGKEREQKIKQLIKSATEL